VIIKAIIIIYSADGGAGTPSRAAEEYYWKEMQQLKTSTRLPGSRRRNPDHYNFLLGLKTRSCYLLLA